MDTPPRGRWKYDEESESFQEVPIPDQEKPEPLEESDDDELHTGFYL